MLITTDFSSHASTSLLRLRSYYLKRVFFSPPSLYCHDTSLVASRKTVHQISADCSIPISCIICNVQRTFWSSRSPQMICDIASPSRLMTALQPQAPASDPAGSAEKNGANVEPQRISVTIADSSFQTYDNLLEAILLPDHLLSFLLSDVSLRPDTMNGSLLTKAAGPARALAHRPLCRQAKLRECSAGFHSATPRVRSKDGSSIQGPLKTPASKRVCILPQTLYNDC